MHNKPETYLTIKETCEYLKVSKSWFGRHYKKHFPFTTLGRKVLFLRSDIDEYMQSIRRDERFLHA
jgi:excisionase family DNA binding protein